MTLIAHLNRLPWMVPNLLLTLAAGVTQGFGLALFVPLLKMMDGSPEKMEFPFSLIGDAFVFVGLPFEFPVVLAVIVGLSIVGMGLAFAQRALLMSLSWVRFVRETSALLVDALLRASWHHASKQATGVTANQLINEAKRAGRALTHVVMAVAAAIQIAVFLVFSVAVSWELLVVAVVFGFVAFMIIRPLQQRAFVYGEDLTAANSTFGFQAVDYLKNLKLVKATGSEGRISEHISRLQATVCDVVSKRQINLATTYFVTQVFPVLLVATVIGIANTVLQKDGTVILVFLLFLARMAPLLSQFQQEYQAYIMDVSAVDLMDSVIAEHRGHREESPSGATVFTELRQGIRFENVSYRFPESAEATVEGIDLTIERAQMVALVGRSGAGKSTMIDLLCGLRRPTGGRILVDGTDLRNIDHVSWRRRIGYVTQDLILFNDTLRNNILFAHPEAPDAQVRRAVDTAHLKEVIETLPEGFDTLMGEGGVRLSGGQKQRLALARALVGDPQLLLLDEATSALDAESERIVQAAIDSLAHRLTIVVVAHRLSTVRKADLICVMENGRIVETGTYDELLTRGRHFRRLLDRQFV